MLNWRVGQRIVERFSDYAIVSPLVRQLIWNNDLLIAAIRNYVANRKNHEQIELLELDSAGIHVAEYLTVLPPKAIFAQRMELAIKKAKQHLAYKNDQNDQSDKDEQK